MIPRLSVPSPYLAVDSAALSITVGSALTTHFHYFATHFHDLESTAGTRTTNKASGGGSKALVTADFAGAGVSSTKPIISSFDRSSHFRRAYSLWN